MSSNKTTKKKAPDKQPALIYCGPSLPKGLLNQFAVYRGGLPEHLKSHFEKCPAIQRLFVPVEDMTKTMQSIQIAGTAESVWFKQVTGYLEGGFN